MNYICFCSAELRFAQLGAFDVPRQNNLESEGVSFAAELGTRWELTASPYLDLEGEIDPQGLHSYTYLFDPGMPPPSYLMVCPDDGQPTPTQAARAASGESEVIRTVDFVLEQRSTIGQAALRCSYFRLFLKPIKRSGEVDQHGFLMT